MTRSRGNPNIWLIAIVVTMGAFMEVLDTTIVIVSLYRAFGGGWEKTVQKLPNPDVSTTPPPLPGALDWVADPDS